MDAGTKWYEPSVAQFRMCTKSSHGRVRAGIDPLADFVLKMNENDDDVDEGPQFSKFSSPES